MPSERHHALAKALIYALKAPEHSALAQSQAAELSSLKAGADGFTDRFFPIIGMAADLVKLYF
jgi:hypothetical protein